MDDIVNNWFIAHVPLNGSLEVNCNVTLNSHANSIILYLFAPVPVELFDGSFHFFHIKI